MRLSESDPVPWAILGEILMWQTGILPYQKCIVYARTCTALKVMVVLWGWRRLASIFLCYSDCARD